MEKDEEERSSDLLEYFNRRSDHIFCFYPSVHPYCDDLLRLKRVQYLIRTEATVFGIPLSYAAEAMWIWLCTHQNTNVSSDSDSNNKDCNYAQIVEDIIRGLNLASFSKLNAIQTSSGQSIISIATKECVQVLKSYSLEIARNQLDVLSAHSNSSIHTSGTSVTSIMKLPNDIKNYTVVIPTNTSETDGGTSKLSSDSQVQNQSQTALSIVHPADSPKLKYIQMNIAPFTRRLFGVSTQHRLLPTTFIILPYKLIQHPITQAVTLLNPSSDSELAVEFARRLVQLQDINVIFYLLMEKIIAHQSMQEPPDGPHLEETCIDNLAWINSDLQTYFTYKEQQHIVNIIESFIQLFSCIEIGYLYLIDDITGTPIVIQSSSSSKEENPKDVYPIQIETPHETVRTVLSFMQIGMILMRGTDKAIYTLIQLLGRNLTPSSNCDSIFQLSTIKHKVVTEALSTSSCPSSSRQNSFLEMIPWLSNECYQQSFFKKARYTTSSIHWEDELSWIHHLCIDLNLQHVHLRPIETSNDNIIWSCESILKESSSSTSHTNHYPLLKKSKDDYKDGKEKQLHDAALEMKKELVRYSNTPTSFHEVGDFEEDITASHDDDDELHDGVDDNNVGDNTQKEESIVDVVLDVNHNNDTTTTTTASPLSISSTASSSEDPANAADENEEQEQQNTISLESIQDTISLESRGPTTRNASNTHHLSAFTNNNNIAQYNDNNEMDGNDDNESLMNNSTVLRYQITSDVMDKLNTIIANNSTNTPITKTTRDMYDNNDADNESLMNNSTIQRQNKFSSNVTNRLTNLITNLSSRTTQTSSSYSIDNDELGSVLLSTQEQRLYNHNHHHHHRTLKIQDSSSSSIISKTSHTDKNRISSSSTNTTATDLKKQTARCKTSHNQHRKQQLHEQQRLERTTTTDSNNIQQQISFQSQVTATSTIRNKRLMNQVLRTDQVFRTDSYNVHTFGTEDEDMDDMISSKSSCTKHNDYNYDSSGKNKKMTAVMENDDDDDDDYAVDHSSTNQHFIPTNVIEKLSRFVVSQGNQHQQTHDNDEQKQPIVPSKQHTNIMNTHTPNQKNHCYNVGNDKNTTTVSTTRAHNNAEVRYISQDKNNSRSRTKNNHHINDDINKIYPSTIATATTKRVSHYEDHHQQKNNNLDKRNTTSTTALDKKIYSTTNQQPNPSSLQVQKQKQAPTIFKENNLTMTEKINKLANLKERNRLVPRIVNIKNPNAINDETSIVSGLTMNINDYSSSIASNTKQHTAAAALKLYNALQLQQQKQKLIELNDSNTTEIHMKVEDHIDEVVLSSSSSSSKNSTRSNKKEQRQQSIPSQQQEHELTIPAGVKEQSLLLSKSDSFDKLVAALDEEDEILKRVIIQHEQQEIIMNSSISSSSSKNHKISSSSSRVSNDKNALSS